MVSPSVIMQAWPMTFSSSRTLPGQECSARRICARRVRPLISLPYWPANLVDEMALEQGQIFLAILQRRHMDLHHGEPVVQILAETFFGDFRAQVAIGGGDHPHVHFARRERSHPQHFLVLQHAQKLGLGGQRHVADLVQEQRAAVGMLEQAGFVVGRAGEGTAHVPEQLAFK